MGNCYDPFSDSRWFERTDQIESITGASSRGPSQRRNAVECPNGAAQAMTETPTTKSTLNIYQLWCETGEFLSTDAERLACPQTTGSSMSACSHRLATIGKHSSATGWNPCPQPHLRRVRRRRQTP